MDNPKQSAVEAADFEHHEETMNEKATDGTMSEREDAMGKSFAVDEFELPKGYFRSAYFLGSMCAIGLSLMCGVAGFSFVAPILAAIDADLGPSPYLNWVAWTYTLTGAVGMMVVGRVTDIFGRRWFFIVGSAIGLLGSIVCAVAPNIPALIAGETLIGLACGTQLSFAFASAELVPQKHRFLALGFCYAWLIPPNGFGAIIGAAFIYESNIGWRGAFYVLVALNAAATACWYFFYYPPNFAMKHGVGRRRKYLKEFDYIGTLLATLGLLLFLMGLSWGGTEYPWDSAHVIACIVVGFFVYEIYVPLKEPLLPMSLCKNRTWVIITFIWAIDASVYYAFAIIWPDMVSVLYADGQNIWAGWASCVVTGGITIGMISAGMLNKRVHWVLRFCFLTGSVLLATMATCTPDTPTRAIVILLIGCIFVGFVECIAASISSLCLEDQREIGTALGLGGSCRSFVSSIGETVYDVILSNRLAQTIPAEVPQALIEAGLPANSTSAFLDAYSVGTQAAFDAVPGLNSTILAVGTAAYKTASSDAYRTVFYSTIAFSAVGLLLTFFIPNMDDKLTGKVTITLHEGNHNDPIVGTVQETSVAEKA